MSRRPWCQAVDSSPKLRAVTPVQARAERLRKRKRAAVARTDEDFLQIAKRIGSAHPFIQGCHLAGIEPTEREVGLWRSGRGRALECAWKRHPKSRNLPRVCERLAEAVGGGR